VSTAEQTSSFAMQQRCRPLYGEQCGGKNYFLKRCLHQAETHEWKELWCDAHFRNTVFWF